MDKNGKILGVLGGLGPMATAYFYKSLIEHTKARCDQDHIDVIISGRASTPDRTKFILTGEGQNPVEYMIFDAKKLQEAGADLIAIPCNTASHFYDEVAKAVDIPVLNIVSETVSFAKRKGTRKVGVMATTGTLESGLYKEILPLEGIDYVLPSPDGQKIIMSLIYDYVKNGKKADKDLFCKVARELFDCGCDRIILGCTELSVLKEEFSLDEKYIDSTEALVFSSIKACGKIPVGFGDTND